MDKNIAVLKGDGIGPEVMREAIKVLEIVSENSNINFVFNDALVGAIAIEKEGNPFPKSTKVLISTLYYSRLCYRFYYLLVQCQLMCTN